VSIPTPPRGTPESAPSARAHTVEAGRLLAARYRLEELVASGGMAQVWQGTDEVLRRKVAVKVLHPHLAADASFVLRFRQEAVAAARLAHPGIVSIYDTCSEDGTEAIVMELVPGRTLRQRLDEPNPIDPWQAAALAAQVAEALEAAHRAGLVHRDVKPANVLLTEDGRVKVADFGIAKAVAEADLTQPGLMVGTAKYVAPEQVEGKPVDARTDIYSLGVVLYEMLCGRPPFDGDSEAATALARLQRDPLRPRQVRPGVPRALEEVVGRAMARAPEHRYASAADLRAALLATGAAPSPEADLTATSLAPAPRPPAPAAAPGPGSGPAPTTAPPPSFRQTERGWLVPTILLVSMAVALGIAGILLGRSGAGDLIGGVKDAITGPPTATAIDLADATATAFDPPCDRSECADGQRGGDDRENQDRAALAIDGDPATAWRTEGYNNPDITVLKPGVGLVIELGSSYELVELEIDSPTNDWRAEIYVTATDPGNLAGWGDPVAVLEDIPSGANPADLGDTEGGAVLIWITNRGDAAGQAPVEITEVRMSGR
jgi:tRNA A-37 threonylcarbamoyl transferase component Bud32